MEQLRRLFLSLDNKQRLTILVVVIAAVASITWFSKWQHEQGFRPLFTSLAPEDAGAMLQRLKEKGVDYRVSEGGTSILVPEDKLAELRLEMASLGLPKTGRIGFEIFDKTNFSATDFAEHVNYRRAIEGELERSVMALAEVEQARVHVTFPKESVFIDAREAAKASVLVKLRPGAELSQQNVAAITHLVASAVEGLSPDAVSVLDMNGNLLGRPHAAGGLDGPESSDASLDYRHKVESDLLAKINSTLEPLLGAEKFRAGVSVECDFSGGEQSEEIYDPARSVMLSSQRTEDSSGANTASGVPGTASTLPRPTSRPGAGGAQVSRVSENVTYQSSRTVKKTRLPAGAVRKMSVAVLLDQGVIWQKDKSGFHRILVPPSADKLKVVHDLVAGVTGFNEQRGDQLVVETQPFETTLLLEPPGSPGPAPAQPASEKLSLRFNQRTFWIIGAAAGGLLLIGLMLAVLRRRSRWHRGEVSSPAELPQAGGASGVEQQLETRRAEHDALQQQMDANAALKLAPMITKTAEIMAKHIREKVAESPELSAQALRSWIREEEA